MALVVQKYGGSSVTDTETIKRVAKRIVETKWYDHNVIVMVSAMRDTTDDLLGLTVQATAHAPEHEMNMLLSAGEGISMSLPTIAMNELGGVALFFTGQQAGVYTSDHFGKAAIASMMSERIVRSINEGNVVIVAGSQGTNKRDDITTLGHGGSDITAVTLAASSWADVREIYTDVDGLSTANPRTVPTTRRIRTIDFESTLEMAAHGAKVLHLRAVEFAHRYRMPLHVRSSFSEKDGAWVSNTTANPTLQGIVPEGALTHYCQEETVEGPVILGIAHGRSQDKLTLVGVPDKPDSAAHIFETVAEAGANIDMIVQNVSIVQKGATDLTVTVPHVDAKATLVALGATQNEIDYVKMAHTGNVGKLPLIDAGIHTNPGASAKLSEAFSTAGINIGMVSASEIRLSILMPPDQLDDAVQAAHTAFGSDSNEVGVVVHGGTGR